MPKRFGEIALADYATEPRLDGDQLSWQPCQTESLDTQVLAAVDSPFDQEGGLRLLTGNLGRGVIKVSAVNPSIARCGLKPW